jgi:hypothetical protein
MRSVRIVVGLVAAVCAFSAFTSAAFAKKPEEKKFFGEFNASRVSGPINEANPILVKSKEGEVEEMKIGPYILKGCTLSAKSNIDFEHSRRYNTTLSFGKCKQISKPEGCAHCEEIKTVHFKLGVVFDANRAAQLGKEGGFGLEEGNVEFKSSGTKCIVKVLKQFIPGKDEEHPEKEYESAEYETSEEAVEGGKLKLYPSGFKDSVNIFMEFKKIQANLILGPKCAYKGHVGEPGEKEEGKLNGKGEVEFEEGKLIGSLTELTASKGEFSFSLEPFEV